jgi:GT2 family glycosyltransferase
MTYASRVESTNSETVSVVILTHNKKEVLRQSLASILRLDWPELEIIVVDNVSIDGTAEMVNAEFGKAVHLICRTVDSPTAGRNEGFRAATGDIILSMDNDMVFQDKTAVRKAFSLFKSFPDVSLIAFKIADSGQSEEHARRHWWHPIPYEIGKDRFFFTDYFCEGAIFVRKSAIMAVGGYDDEFFGGFEGVDLAFKLIAGGFRLLYSPTISSVELVVGNPTQQSRSPWNYFFLRNKIWTAWKHFPPFRGLWFVAPRIAHDAYRSLIYGWTGQFWRGFKDGLFPPRTIRAQRRPLNSRTWTTIRELRRGQFCDVGDVERGRVDVSLSR